MKLKTNLVSLFAGAALGAAAVLSIAAAPTSTETQYCGRFQLLVADTSLFKIDTATGQVWHTWINSPTKEFMRPNIGAPVATGTNSGTQNLEKNAEKKTE